MKKAKLAAALFLCAFALAVSARAEDSAKDECSKIPTPSFESAVGDWRLGTAEDGDPTYMKIYPDGTWVSVMPGSRSGEKIYQWAKGKIQFQYGMIFLGYSFSGKSRQLKFNEADWKEKSSGASGATVCVQKDRIYLSAMVALGGHTGIIGSWAQYSVDGTPESAEIERIAVTFGSDGKVLVTDFSAPSWDAPFEKADDDEVQSYRLEDEGGLILSSDGEDSAGHYLIIGNYLLVSVDDPSASALVRISEAEDPIAAAFDGSAPRYQDEQKTETVGQDGQETETAENSSTDDDGSTAEDADEGNDPASSDKGSAALSSLPSHGLVLSTQDEKDWILLEGADIESVSLLRDPASGALTVVDLKLSRRGWELFGNFALDYIKENIKIVINGGPGIEQVLIRQLPEQSEIQFSVSEGGDRAREIYRELIDISAQ